MTFWFFGSHTQQPGKRHRHNKTWGRICSFAFCPPLTYDWVRVLTDHRLYFLKKRRAFAACFKCFVTIRAFCRQNVWFWAESCCVGLCVNWFENLDSEVIAASKRSRKTVNRLLTLLSRGFCFSVGSTKRNICHVFWQTITMCEYRHLPYMFESVW